MYNHCATGLSCQRSGLLYRTDMLYAFYYRNLLHVEAFDDLLSKGSLVFFQTDDLVKDADKFSNEVIVRTKA